MQVGFVCTEMRSNRLNMSQHFRRDVVTDRNRFLRQQTIETTAKIPQPEIMAIFYYAAFQDPYTKAVQLKVKKVN